MLLPAITGKVEMVYEGEQQGAEVVARKLIGQAVKKVFGERFPEIGKEVGTGGEDDQGPYAPIIAWFAAGNEVTISDEQPFAVYEAELTRVPGLIDLAGQGAADRHERALARRADPGEPPPAPQARPPGPRQPGQLQGDDQVPAPQAAAGGRSRRGELSAMRHRYFYLDPELIRAILAGLDLLRLFNQLVLATGGDVDEAMEWMRYLQEQGYLPEDLDLEAFFASLEEQQLVQRDGEGGLAAHRRRRAAPPAQRLRAGLRRPRSAPAPATTRCAPFGDGVERQPESRPYKLRRRRAAPRRRPLAPQLHEAHPRRASTWPRTTSRSSRPSS